MDAIQLNWALMQLKMLQNLRVWILHRVVTEKPKMNGYTFGITENKTCTPKGHLYDIKHMHRWYYCFFIEGIVADILHIMFRNHLLDEIGREYFQSPITEDHQEVWTVVL